jgi:hypothetical protein
MGYIFTILEVGHENITWSFSIFVFSVFNL